MSAPLIDIRDAWKIYHVGEVDVQAVRGVSLEVPHGQFIAVTGASGSGKSTFMHLLGCLDQLTRGTYAFEGRRTQDLSRLQLAALRNKRIGFVFQSFNLLARTSVIENVALPLTYQGVRRRERRKRAEEMLVRVGLADRLRHHTNQLSGGEQQRVAIARALVNEPEILLADEPTGNLDPDLTLDIMDLIASAALRGTSVIVATHELSLVERYGKRRVRLEGGQIVDDSGPVGSHS